MGSYEANKNSIDDKNICEDNQDKKSKMKNSFGLFSQITPEDFDEIAGNFKERLNKDTIDIKESFASKVLRITTYQTTDEKIVDDPEKYIYTTFGKIGVANIK